MALGMKTDGYVRNGALLNQPRVSQMAWVKMRTTPGGNLWPVCGFMQSPGSAVLDKDLVIQAVVSDFLLEFSVYDTVAAGTKQVQGTTKFVIDRWYHVAATADGVNIKVFVNGVLEGTTASGPTYASYTGSGTFFASGHGSRGDTTTRYLDGSLAHVAMWDEALTEGQIRQIAQGGLRPGGAWPASPGVPKIYWPMNALGVQYDYFVASDGQDYGTVNGTVWADQGYDPRPQFIIGAGAFLAAGDIITVPFLASGWAGYEPTLFAPLVPVIVIRHLGQAGW